MLKILIAIVFSLFFASFINSQPVWSSCGSSSDTFQIGNVVISPNTNVSPGDIVTVNVTGTLTETITQATVTASLSINGTPFPPIKQNLCGISTEFQCPIAAGPQKLGVSQQIPAYLPTGSYIGQFQVVDQTGAEVACIKFTFQLQAGQMDPSSPILNDKIIEQVNQQGKWKASRNKRFEGVTVAEAKSLLGTHLTPFTSSRISKINNEAASIPTAFDSRTQWPGCIHPVLNQGQCGSCWAFGATESLSDRFCISSNGKVNVVLSPEYLVSCDTTNYGCNGGYLENAWEYLENPGTCTMTCFPYSAGNGDAPACRKTCTNGDKMTLYTAQQGSIVQPQGVPAIQTEIMTNGPVEGAFNVYQDFFSYTSGVYVHTSGSLAGGHAIKIIGWGVDTTTNQDYWIVQNSWGTSWGMSGFFWILRGVDECGIESNIISAKPNLSSF